jgi:hypothetical protein
MSKEGINFCSTFKGAAAYKLVFPIHPSELALNKLAFRKEEKNNEANIAFDIPDLR